MDSDKQKNGSPQVGGQGVKFNARISVCSCRVGRMRVGDSAVSENRILRGGKVSRTHHRHAAGKEGHLKE